MKKYLKTDEWNIIEDQFHPDRQRMSESIFSLGNGRFGQRGYFEEPYSSDSYRGSFVAGITFLDKTRVGWWKNGFPPYYTRIPKAADWSRINLRLIDEEAPKWGNDDPEADAMVIDLTSFIIKKIAAFRGLLGNQKLPALYPVSSNVPQGMAVGALPSGRRAFRPIAEGCSPCQGADRTGPTAVLRSLGKLPHTCIDGGTLLNLKFTPASVEGEAGRIRLSAFLKSFLDLDVFHVQFNVVGHEVLRCAQAHPEEYKSLLVRVAGYSAYFVELSREVQDDILSRTVNTQ